MRRCSPTVVHWIVVAWIVVAVSAGCGRNTPPQSTATAKPAATVRAVETADHAMRRALASALQARGKEAVAALRSLDPAALAARYAPTHSCMLERLGARRPPAIPLSDRFLTQVLAAYREYWLRSLLAERPERDNEAWLLAALNARVVDEGGRPAASLDDLEPALDALIRERGYQPLLGVTSPLRELMLWKTETTIRYDVTLPRASSR